MESSLNQPDAATSTTRRQDEENERLNRSASLRSSNGRGHLRQNSEPPPLTSLVVDEVQEESQHGAEETDDEYVVVARESAAEGTVDRRQLYERGWSMGHLDTEGSSSEDAANAQGTTPQLDLAQLHESWTTGDGDALFGASSNPLPAATGGFLGTSCNDFSARATSFAELRPTRRASDLTRPVSAGAASVGRLSTLASTSSIGRSTSRSISAATSTSDVVDTISSSSTGVAATHTPKISSVLHDAARITNWDKVLQLCRTHPELARYAGRDGWTALHHACNRRCPHAHVVEALIHAYPGALLKQEEKGWLPLHYASRFKAPKAVVRLLLYLYPAKGLKTVSQLDRQGRTPLYYAIRYEAPPGVVGLLLEVDPSAVLEEDQNDESPLALVWDSWAEKLEGKRIVNSFLPGGFPEPENTTVEQRAKLLRERLFNEPKLLKRWIRVNVLLKAAFGFPVEDDEDNDDGGVDDTNDKGTPADEDSSGASSSKRVWRIVHATAAVKCHLSLFLLACALHPEQVHELDESDLQRPGGKTGYTGVPVHQTALHLAASSNAGGEPGKTVLLTLLSQYREAAQMPDGIDKSLPLHRMVENQYKDDWSNHAAILYRFYPRALQTADANGKLPLHRAAAAIRHVALQEEEESVIVQLMRFFPQAAVQVDNGGCLPLHLIAGNAAVWDAGVQSVFDFHRNAVSVRAGPEHLNRLPLHMAAANAKATDALISRLVQYNPRGASMPDRDGKLPLHLACEIGKDWERGGVQNIYNAFPRAVQMAEDNARGWLPLHMAAAAPESNAQLISSLIELYPEAVSVPDGDGRYPLHIACDAGKGWSDGIDALFQADPAPMAVADNQNMLPFFLAALRHCHSNVTDGDEDDEIEDLELKLKAARDSVEASKADILFNLLRADPTVLSNDS